MEAVGDKVKRPRTSVLYWLYLRALESYQALPDRRYNVFRLGFENFIKTLAVLGSAWLRIKFPSRSIGGWCCTWRWRWEFIAHWYEYETVQWCRQLVKPGMLIIDIGAHIGYFTWLFSDLVGDRGKVIAFEPSPENYPLLLHNIEARKCQVVEPACKALSDFIGEIEFFVSQGHTTHGLIEGFSENEGSITVESTTVDAYLDELGNPSVDFVKIDVEGAEPRVLSGMVETIRRNPKLILLVELNPRALKAGRNSAQGLISQLEALGFVSMEIEKGGRLVPPLENTTDKTRNLLCVREGHSSLQARLRNCGCN